MKIHFLSVSLPSLLLSYILIGPAVQAGTIPAMTGSYVLNDTFNGDTTGSAPTGWTVNASGGSALVQQVPSAANKSVNLQTTGSANSVASSYSFAPTTGEVVVEVKARADTKASSEEFPTILSSTGVPAVAVAFSGGNITATNGTSLTTIQTYNLGEWYVIRVDLNTTTGTYNLYIDGVEALTNASFVSSVPNVSQVRCALDSGAAGNAYYDSAKVYSHAGLIGAPPSPVFDILSYGAVADGKTVNTAAIQKTINACAGTGGSVYIHGGTYMSGTLILGSNMTLYIDSSAILLGSTNTTYGPVGTAGTDYPFQPMNTANVQLPGNLAFIFANGATNVNIDGGGTIDGSGYLSAWNVAGPTGVDERRPVLMTLFQCSNVRVQNLYVRNSAYWGLVPLESSYVAIRNITEDTPYFYNRDGMDIVDSQNVLIENSTIYSEDDSICCKSGIAAGTNYLTVAECNICGSIQNNGLKLGTGSYGQFTNCSYSDVMIKHVDKGAISVESTDGANISNLSFRGIDMNDTSSPFYVIIGDRDETPSGSPTKVAGTIDSLLFEDITATNLRYNIGCPISGLLLSGTTYPLTNLEFVRCNITFPGGSTSVPSTPPEMGTQYPECNDWGNLPAYGYFIRHAPNVTFTDCTTSVATADARPPVVLVDANINNYSYQLTPPTGLQATSTGSQVQLSWQAASAATNSWASPYVDDGNSSVGYTAGWALQANSPAYLGTDHLSTAVGATATFPFTGNGIRLYATEAANLGQAAISIDGSSVGTVDLYNANTSFQQVAYQNASLASGNHTLTVAVSGAKNSASSGTAIVVDAFQTGSTTPVAVDYDVYRSIASDSPGSLIGTTSALSYTDTTATPGVTYYYTISAAVPGDETTPDATVTPTSAPILADTSGTPVMPSWMLVVLGGVLLLVAGGRLVKPAGN